MIFTSDNGYFQGEHRRRQGKTMPYEPALRIPLLMRGPGIRHGVSRAAPFLMVDFAPTILAAARTRPRASIDGQSMLRIARRGGGHWHRGVLTETGPPWTIRYAPPRTGSRRHVRPFSVGVRTQHFMYVRHLTGEVELYDMRRDPHQFTNVADQPRYADVRQRLARVLRDLRDCDGRECRRPLSSW